MMNSDSTTLLINVKVLVLFFFCLCQLFYPSLKYVWIECGWKFFAAKDVCFFSLIFIKEMFLCVTNSDSII